MERTSLRCLPVRTGDRFPLPPNLNFNGGQQTGEGCRIYFKHITSRARFISTSISPTRPFWVFRPLQRCSCISADLDDASTGSYDVLREYVHPDPLFWSNRW